MAMVFCPRCGRKLVSRAVDGHEHPVCDRESGGCGYIDFGRYALGVGGLVVREQFGEPRVLLIQRNQEPNRGTWTIPGGFCEWNEMAEQAVVREVWEETGLVCESIGMVAFRHRVDPEVNNSYVVFSLQEMDGDLGEPNEEVAAVGFFNADALDHLPRLAPLSHTLASAALAGRLLALPATVVPGWKNNQPTSTLFLSTGIATDY